jgi:hypothetical protein
MANRALICRLIALICHLPLCLARLYRSGCQGGGYGYDPLYKRHYWAPQGIQGLQYICVRILVYVSLSPEGIHRACSVYVCAYWCTCVLLTGIREACKRGVQTSAYWCICVLLTGIPPRELCCRMATCYTRCSTTPTLASLRYAPTRLFYTPLGTRLFYTPF